VRRSLLALSTLSLVAMALPAQASSKLDNIGALNQSQFRLLSEDMTAALSYKPLTPAEPLGVLGFDLGIEVESTKLQNPEVWDLATLASAPSSLIVPKLQVSLGLPLGFDVGAFYSEVPDSNMKLWGGELRYAIVPGGTATPAVAIRADYTRLEGVNQLSFDTTGVDISISKGFAFVTPYGGIGEVWSNSTPNGIPTLSKESLSMTKYFVGVNVNLAIINIAVEADKTGDAPSYGVKLGWRF
jgi:hypothetical protein